jgi:hypothetical protein
VYAFKTSSTHYKDPAAFRTSSTHYKDSAVYVRNLPWVPGCHTQCGRSVQEWTQQFGRCCVICPGMFHCAPAGRFSELYLFLNCRPATCGHCTPGFRWISLFQVHQSSSEFIGVAWPQVVNSGRRGTGSIAYLNPQFEVLVVLFHYIQMVAHNLSGCRKSCRASPSPRWDASLIRVMVLSTRV